MTTQKNTGRLCSVYCPACGKVTDKISWNLLREAKSVYVTCPLCGETTLLEYKEGTGASVLHGIADYRELAAQILKSSGSGKDFALSLKTIKNHIELLTAEASLPLGEESEEDANLTLEKIKELHDGVEKRIEELKQKDRARLAEKKGKKN